MKDQEFYERRVKPLLPTIEGSNTASWEMLSEHEKEQIAQLRLEEERVP